jgi:ubiquinone/menaquinone biosynthesis C-methylase UbiE
MSVSTKIFYDLIFQQINSSTIDSIKIYNKLNEDDLKQPEDIVTLLYTIITLECKEVKLLKKVDPKLISLKDFIQTSSELDILCIVLKILIIFYRLKNKLKIHLGKINVDYDIYISNEKESWSSFMNDKFDFINVNQVYIIIHRPIRFFYKGVVYQTPSLSTNKYYFKDEDEDFYYFYNYLLTNLRSDNILSFFNKKNIFGDSFMTAIERGEDITNLLINKNKDINFLKTIFLEFYTFDKQVQKKIIVNNNIEPKSSSISVNKNEKLEELYKQSLKDNFNFIQVYNNLPNNLEYNKFNIENLDKNYELWQILSICNSAINILYNYKLYLQLTTIPDIKTYKLIMELLNKFNDLYYNSANVFWNQIYYLLFNFTNKEYVLEYYFKNILTDKNSYFNFIINYFKELTIEIDNNYNPTFTLQQIPTLYKKDPENIIKFLVKKIYNIKESDKEHSNKYSTVDTIVKSNNNDLDIYYNLIPYLISESEKTEFEGRGEVRVNQLISLFNSREFKTINKTIKYLDYGGGDGEITAAIARHIKSAKDNTYIVDIEQWFGNIYNTKYIDYLTYGTITTYKLPFENDSVNFITCFQVLHHIKDYKKIIEEFYRIIAPGGIIVLREHDCRDEYDKMLIDVEHSIYETTLKRNDKNSMCNYLSEYEAYYLTRTEWNSLFEEYGFKNITRNIDNKLSEPRTAARYYFDIYTK